MPKIIENVREQLLAEAKKQIAERGYANTTVRSVAGACGIGVGTVYNYFKSKDMLIASFMLEDWQECLADVRAHESSDAVALLRSIYEALLHFSDKHKALFADAEATRVFSTVFSKRHKQLREQLADLISPIAKDDFAAAFIAESLLTWTMAGVPFEQLSDILMKIIK
jgi:AcrR family transcriptional regulator